MILQSPYWTSNTANEPKPVENGDRIEVSWPLGRPPPVGQHNGCGPGAGRMDCFWNWGPLNDVPAAEQEALEKEIACGGKLECNSPSLCALHRWGEESCSLTLGYSSPGWGPAWCLLPSSWCLAKRRRMSQNRRGQLPIQSPN